MWRGEGGRLRQLSRKLCMENLLAPCGVSSFCPDKAAEIFVQGREEIHVMVSGEGMMVGGEGVMVGGEGVMVGGEGVMVGGKGVVVGGEGVGRE